MINLRRVSWTICVGALLAGCGPGHVPAKMSDGGFDGGLVASGPISIDDFGAALLAAECQHEVQCLLMSDQQYCASSLGPNLTGRKDFDSFGAMVAAEKLGEVKYDASAARSCIDAIAALDCASQLPYPGVGPCQPVFAGVVGTDASCIASEECQSGWCSLARGDPPCAGTCRGTPRGCWSASDCMGGQVCNYSTGGCVTPVPPGAANQPCGTYGECQAGNFCSIPGGSSHAQCLPRRQAGQSCVFAIATCATGLTCIPTDDFSSMSCGTSKAKGASCQHLYECGTYRGSTICDPSSHTCVDRPSSGPCVGGVCNTFTAQCDASQSPPTCVPFIADGQPCDTSGGLHCLPSSSCQASDGGTQAACRSPSGPACTL